MPCDKRADAGACGDRAPATADGAVGAAAAGSAAGAALALPPVDWHGSVSSTNDLAIDAARLGACHGHAVAAAEQTDGRGRRGHAWASPEGGLYVSIVLRPSVGMRYFMALPAVASMGVMDALRTLAPAGRIGIKWPNDIVACTEGDASAAAADAPAADAAAGSGGAAPLWLSCPYDRKLAGILVEARSGEDGPFAVAGIGVNLRCPDAASVRGAGAAPAALEPVGLAELASGGVPIPAPEKLAESVRNAVVARVDAWAKAVDAGRAAAGPLAPVLSEYFDMIPALGRTVAVLTPEGRVFDTGTFSGVDVWGRASVQTPAGKERVFPAEAASLREV